MTDEPRTPLTLEYSPEPLDIDEPQGKPVVIIEPSMAHDGRIFVGIHPLGAHPNEHIARSGAHLLPEDARLIMNHLAKLLMEDPPEVPAARKRPTPKVNLKMKVPRAEFRFEFRLGKIVGVVGTRSD